LTCKNKTKTRNNTTRVSKTASVSEVLDEIKYIRLIQEADPQNKYHLGDDYVCDINDSHNNRTDLKQCGAPASHRVINFLQSKDMQEDAHTILDKGLHEKTIGLMKGYQPKNVADLTEYADALYAMIIMKYGGPTVQMWTKKPNYTKKERATFIVESRRLFEGVIHFQNHGIILNDVKPANVVYDGRRFNFIDFGMTKLIEEVKKLALTDEYVFSILHWNFPWEMYFLNKSKFNAIQKPTEYTFQIIENKTSDFFTVTKENKDPYMKDFYEFSQDVLSKRLTYDDFVDKCLRTIDSFGLGLTMLSWLRSLEGHEPELEKIYKAMICQNVSRRMTVQTAILELDLLLEKYSLLAIDSPLGDYQDSPSLSLPQQSSSSSQKKKKKKTVRPGF
jgi:hypothetical protein